MQQTAPIVENEKFLIENHLPCQVTEKKIDVQEENPQNLNDTDITAQVKLINAVRLPANYSAAVPVQVAQIKGTILIEPSKSLDHSLQVEKSLLEVKEDGSAAMMIVNNSNTSVQLKKGLELGQAIGVEVVDHTLRNTSLSTQSKIKQQIPESLNVFSVTVPPNISNERVKWRQKQMGNFLSSAKLSEKDQQLFEQLLSDYHDVFSLEEDERGETSLLEFEIDTGAELPRKQAARRLPYAAQQEVAEQ